MPIFGAHMSIAGGLHLAFERIRRIGGEAMQIFVKNQRQWLFRSLSRKDAETFRTAWEESGWIPVAAHASYLINLASPDRATRERSVAGFADELGRCRTLGIRYLVLHPGAHGGSGLDSGIRTFVESMDRAIETADAPGVMVLIETMAGQGTGLGAGFGEIARILKGSRFGDRAGVCFDTSHVFAAGHDISTPEGYQRVMDDFDRTLGLGAIRWFHLNDSKAALGSRVDRHEHIGRGNIGLEGFRLLVNDPRFQDVPMVLETPKEKDMKEDMENLKCLRSLVE